MRCTSRNRCPDLTWHSSDVASNLDGLARRIVHASLENLPEPIRLDVDHRPWACGRYDAVFTANSLHIMSENSVENFFAEISDHMNAQAQLLVYGPFKYEGEFTTPSNASFDEWLKERNPVSGIRDFEWINALAQRAGLRLKQDLSMPANNQLLVWDTAQFLSILVDLSKICSHRQPTHRKQLPSPGNLGFWRAHGKPLGSFSLQELSGARVKLNHRARLIANTVSNGYQSHAG